MSRTRPNVHTLILGRDASGKSTLLNGIQEKYGDSLTEAATTKPVRSFKRRHLETVVDLGFVDARERLYLGLCLSRSSLKARSEALLRGNVTTTSDSLVTRVSHQVMRSIVSEHESFSAERAVDQWQDDIIRTSSRAPDLIAMTYVPCEVANSRMRERQEAGMVEERFWGFNSPFFLERYQTALVDTLRCIGSEGLATTVCIDTSDRTISETLDAYSDAREQVSLVQEPAVFELRR